MNSMARKCHHKIFICGNHDACLHGANTGGAAGVRCLCVCCGRLACGGEGRMGLPGMRGNCACVKKNRSVRRWAQLAGGQRVAKRAGWRGETGRLGLPGGLFRLAVQSILRCGVGVAVAGWGLCREFSLAVEQGGEVGVAWLRRVAGFLI